MSGEPLLVIGDALLDRDVEGRVERLSPDAPVPVLDERALSSRPGGAGLAALLAAADRHPVALVTALAADAAGAELGDLLIDRGIELIDLGLDGATPEKVRFRANDRSLMRLDRGGAPGAVGPAPAAARAAIEWASAVLVSDYGRGVAADHGLREALASAAGHLAVVWDPHPRGPVPPPGLTVATPNESEVEPAHAGLAQGDPTSNGSVPVGSGIRADIARAAILRARWDVHALCVTRGAEGALVVREGRPPLAAPAMPAPIGDACGAGDRFASRLAGRLAGGSRVEDAVLDAVACASAFVAAGGARAALPDAEHPDAGNRAVGPSRIEQVRAAGGTVVATGGCFDLIHAGHVRTLEAARRLGDALVVLLNSDDSVRRLKGSDRRSCPSRIAPQCWKHSRAWTL